MSWLVVYVMISSVSVIELTILFLFQAEDGIRDLVRSRGLGDVYKRQAAGSRATENDAGGHFQHPPSLARSSVQSTPAYPLSLIHI